MSRRRFLGILSGAAASWTLCARAQQETKIPRIGLLAPGRSEGADASRGTLNSLVAGLRELGYTEGQNIVIERRFGESNPDRLRKVTDELIELKVDVIVALSTTAARPAKQATSWIPIVAIGMADPVEDELVASLARPGGNVTGTSFLGPELVAKRLQLLGQVVPQLVRVAVLLHPRAYSDRTMDGMSTEIERAAQTLGMKLQLVPAAGPEDIAGAFSAMARERAAALSLFPSPMLFAEYGRIASLAAENVPFKTDFRNKIGHNRTRAPQQNACYSITSSAMEKTPEGMARPSAFAVLRLMSSSNLVGCCTGNSAGLVPLRILST